MAISGISGFDMFKGDFDNGYLCFAFSLIDILLPFWLSGTSLSGVLSTVLVDKIPLDKSLWRVRCR